MSYPQISQNKGITYLADLLWEWNEITRVKHLPKYLAHSENGHSLALKLKTKIEFLAFSTTIKSLLRISMPKTETLTA